jgi:hypothetical protein
MSALFDPEPRTWGLRGDLYLWQALRARLAGQDVPASAGELTGVLHAAFRELAASTWPAIPPPRCTGSSTHGGMSSGMISLDTWRQRLMPLLAERAGTRLPGRLRETSPDQTLP